MPLSSGEYVAGFRVERELGAGGMGEVYLARHPRLPRLVALKLLRTDLADDPAFVERFRREADTVARLDHPNIVAVDDVGADRGRLWLSMRYVDGTTAARAVADRPGGLPPARVVHIVERVAAALDFAHRAHLVHRDVKPANILLAAGDDGEPERVFLSDFGVAKTFGDIEAQAAALTAAGGVIATIDYAAPEQIDGRPLDGRCDVYALGCVLYKLLTGVVPYPGATVAAKVYARLNTVPPPPSSLVPGLPPAFDAIVERAMRRDPDARYQTCRALAVDARAALGPTPTRAPVVGQPVARPPVAAAAPIPDPTVRVPTPDAGTRTTMPFTPPPVRPDPGPGRPPGRRRRVVLIGLVVVIVAVLASATILLVRNHNRLAAAASTGPGSSSTAAPSGAPPTSAASRASTTPAGSAGSSASASGAVPSASASGAVPVPGLPHGDPLDPDVLVVSRLVDGTFALYSMDAGTGRVITRLTDPRPHGQGPLISTERGTVVYAQGGDSGNTIRAVAADGSGDRLLFGPPTGCTSMNRPAWNSSRQQELIVPCVQAGGSITVLRMDLTGAVLGTIDTGLPIVDDLTLSPDGRLLAFWGSQLPNKGSGSLYVQDLAAGTAPLAITAAGATDPDFSPDGRLIAYRELVTVSGRSSTQISVITPAGTGHHQVTRDTSGNSQGPAWSPDGSRIAFKNDQPVGSAKGFDEIWVVGLDGSNPRRLGIDAPGMVSGSPAWALR